MQLVGRSGVEEIDPSYVPLIVSEAIVSQYFQVAVATFLLFDTIINMDKEVKYFWSSPRKSVSIVYFTIRYTAVFASLVFLNWNALDVNITLCRLSAWTFNLSNWLIIALIDYILMIRVLALYSQERVLSVILSIFLGLEVASKLAIIIYLTIYENVTVGALGNDMTTCGFDAALPKLWGTVDWVIPLFFALTCLVLALYKAAEFWRTAAGFKNFRLVNVLIQDQVIYFFFVVTCSVFNILVYNVNTQDNFGAQVMVLLGSPLLLSVLGSRMLINLKEAGENGGNAGTSYKLKTISALEFA